MRALLLSVLTAASPAGIQAPDAQGYRGESIYGVGPSDLFGRELAAGDFNGDGYNDVFAVSESGDGSDPFDDGEVHVFFGASDFPIAGLDADDADLVLSDAATDHRFGHSLAVGDLNGDGFADAVVGVPYNNDRVDESGAAYVYCGSATPDATRDRILYGRLTVDNNPDMPGVADEGFNLGQRVDVGDLNGDGFGDVVVGGFSSGEGDHEYHVFLGSAGVCSGPPINAEDANSTTRINPGSATAYEDVAIGDLNNDGYDDLVVVDTYDWFHPSADRSGGAVFVFYGEPTLPATLTVDSVASPNDADAVILLFEDNGAGGSNLTFMPHVASGELSGDGFDDIAVMSNRIDSGTGQPAERFAYVYRGGASLAPLSVVAGGEAEISFGGPASSAADVRIGKVSADAQEDLLVATVSEDFDLEPGIPTQYLFDGPLSFPSSVDGYSADLIIATTGAVPGSGFAPETAPVPIGITNGAVCPGFGIGRPNDRGRADIHVCTMYAFPLPDFPADALRCASLFGSWERGFRLCDSFFFELSPGVLLGGDRMAMSFGGVFIEDPDSNDPDNPDLIDVTALYDIDRNSADCPDPGAGCVRYTLNKEGEAQVDRLRDVFVEVIADAPEVAVTAAAVSFAGQIRLITNLPLILPASPSLFGSYDLYAHLPASGTTVQVSSIPDRGEFNPSWAPFGPYAVHDVAAFGPGDAFLGQELAITNAATGASALLPNTDGGNDADWWPFGLFIAYDRAAVPGAPDETVYLSSALGGPRLALRADAVDPSWSPTGLAFAFRQPSDGSIRARGLLSGSEALVAAAGQNPSWSPDGRSIAYSDGDDLWRVPVLPDGTPTGPPVAVTLGPDLDSQPAWTPGGGRLVYQSDASGAVDLYAVPASGGAGAFLTGDPAFGDFDPAVYPSRQIQAVLYAGYTDPSARVAGGAFEADRVPLGDLLASAPAGAGALAAALGLGDAPGAALDAWLTETLGGQAVAAETGPPAALAVAAYPNPASASVAVRLDLPEAADVEVVVLDALGREVARLVEGLREPGVHVLPWRADVPAGVYLVRVRSGDAERVRRVTVVR